MPKRGQHDPSPTSKRSQARQSEVARGGSTRVSRPHMGRSGSDSNKSSKTRGS